MPFKDAPQWSRCRATIRLKDGSFAQCGRWHNPSYFSNPNGGQFCTQHGDLWFSRKPHYHHEELRQKSGYCPPCWCAKTPKDKVS